MRTVCIILSLFITGVISGKTWVVGKQQAVKTIREAIRLAKDGDTIFVKPGLYREGKIEITKQLTLIGENYPVIDGESKVENFVISGKNICLKGFLIRDSRHSSSNDYSAINIIDAYRITIEDNKIVNAHFGIHVGNSKYCVIRNNQIQGFAVSEQSAGNGIHMWKSSHATLEHNRIRGHRDGIYFEFVTDSYIRNNTSEKNIRYGLHFMFSHNDTYTGNIFRDNGTGVAVMYTHNVRMEKNTFSHNWGSSAYGILLKDISDSYVSENEFIENTIGIFMEGSSRIEMKKNLFRNNGWALKVQANCENNQINYNNFEGNTFDVSTNGTLVLSNFDNNYWDKYEGYDRNRDGTGDVPYYPVSVYSMIVQQNPNSLILLRSFMVSLLDKAEKAIPSLTPENLIDKKPMIKPNKL